MVPGRMKTTKINNGTVDARVHQQEQAGMVHFGQRLDRGTDAEATHPTVFVP